MNKKAFVFLYICTIAFIIAIPVFYGGIGKQTPGGKTLYLGQNELELFQTYQEAEQTLYAIELAALLSAKQASPENFQQDFEEAFSPYLEKYGLKKEAYTFTYVANEGTMTIIGTTEQLLEFQEKNYMYKIPPNFKVQISYEGTEEEQILEEDVFV